MPGPADPWPVRRDISVLLVHPDAAARDRYRRVLEAAGYKIEEAIDEPSALTAVARTMPDVIVLDVAEDSEPAVECVQQLNADPITCDIPVIALIADIEELDIPGRLESAVDDCLIKPCATTELLMRVRSMARLRQHRLELLEHRSLHGEQARAWGVLMDFTRAVTRITNLDELFAQIVSTAAEMTSSRRVSLMLPDKKQQFLMIAQCIGLDEEIARNVRVPIGEAVSGEAYRTGRPVTTLDDHESLADRKGYDFQSFVSMPMIYTPMSMVYQRVGVLNISNRYGDRRFEEWELEFIDLLGSFAGSAIDDIHSRETRESLLKVERDLQLAREIQRKTFPDKLPELSGFDLYAWSEPAEETAGDTYDVIGYRAARLGPNVLTTGEAERAYLLLADATGHGIGPALSVTQVRAMLRMAVRMKPQLSRIARHLNEQLCADLPGGRFVTTWLGEVNTRDHTIISFSAGQAPILRYEAAADRWDVLPADTMPLGISMDLDIKIGDPIPMNPGDILAVISDGFFEAVGRDGVKFGIDRVLDLLSAHHLESARQIHVALCSALAEFTGDAPADDDRTAIIVKRLAA